MKQVLQNRRSGELSVAEVPVPANQRGRLLVRTAASLISAGTERMAVELGQKSLVGKARERPDLVKQVIQKVKTEGLGNTMNAVRARLDSTSALGYSAAGIVVEVGEGITEFRAGDRVACAGAGYASHAEVICVPQNLCVQLPPQVSFESGAFGTLGAIALQGVRLAEPTLGESVVVIGLGLLGQLTVQLLKANGCRVFGLDLDSAKMQLALELGADAVSLSGAETKREVMQWTRGRGADAVVITAATMSDEPVRLAGEISRLKGRVVAVGLVGLNVPRNLYYDRELSLTVSRSYGPGRYDPEFEERGHDYPFAYVRWSETRNLEAFLDLVAQQRINIERLISHRFPIEEGERAYDLITGETKEPYLGVVLTYDTERELQKRVELVAAPRTSPKQNVVRVGVIGAGNYVRGMLLPKFKSEGAEFHSIATASGVSALDVGKQFGFKNAVSAADEVISDADINLVVVGTRHDTHADLAYRVLAAGKHVFVEKPLALDDEELDAVLAAARDSSGRLIVGFNRRFAPLAVAAKELFAGRQSPLSIVYRVNSGRIAREQWQQDPEQGGRIIGEVCHFVDLMQFLTGSPPVSVFAESISARSHQIVDEDSVLITLRFADGSNGVIAYLAEGDTSMPKERVEIFGDGKSFVLDDFRSATSYKGGREQTTKLRRQDKGQAEEIRRTCEMVLAGGPAPITLAELAATTRATFRIRDSLKLGQPVGVISDE